MIDKTSAQRLTNITNRLPQEVTKYIVVGGLGALIQVLLTTALVTYSHLHYAVAAIVGFVVSLCLSFILQRSWTFADRETTNTFRMMASWYTLISVFGVGLNIVLLYFLIQLLGLAILPADTIAIVIVAATNYALNSRITFRASTP